MTQFTNRLTGPRFLGMTFAALAASMVVGIASAASSTDARSMKVNYSDLNLASDAGTQTLYSRIASAARSVCGTHDVDNRDLRGLASARQCESNAIANAVSAVHSERLAALYSARVARG
jgi:UrcA family protein